MNITEETKSMQQLLENMTKMEHNKPVIPYTEQTEESCSLDEGCLSCGS